MTSYFSSLTSSSAISNISTRFTSLRRAISSSEEDDPDYEDSSHISNVLRAYYNEKGRRLPPWLPPDRKTAANAAPATIATQPSFQGYGGRQDGAPAAPPPGAGRGGLGDLWGDSGPPQRPQQQTSSLRMGRSAHNTPQSTPAASLHPSAGGVPSRPATTTPSSNRRGYFDRSPSPNPGARPLPSQKAGSYQASQSATNLSRPSGPDRASSNASAQERLRARFQGGGSSGYSSPQYENGGGGGGGGLARKPIAGQRPW